MSWRACLELHYSLESARTVARYRHDGPLRVLPGTHTQGRLSPTSMATLRQQGTETVCTAPAGAALLMRPLLVHASSKSTGTSRRRVLHFAFGPATLPHGLRWHTTA